MFCTKCGAELKEGARFCARCGAPTSAAQVEISKAGGTVPEAQPEMSAAKAGTSAASATGASVPAGQPVQGTQENGAGDGRTPQTPQAAKGDLKYLAAGGAVLALLLVLGIGGALFFRAHRGDTPDGSGEAAPADGTVQEGEEGTLDWREMTPCTP